MTMPFASPAAPGDGITWTDLNGCLLLIDVLSIETGIKTSFGDADAVRANVAVLDGMQAGTEYADTLVFPKVLQGQLKSRVGQKVLGRLGQGAQKPGQSPPWMLFEATEADQQLGLTWLQRTVTAPAAPQPQQPQQQPPVNQTPQQQWAQQSAGAAVAGSGDVPF